MKLQWNKAEWRLTNKELNQALLDAPYSEKKGRGFILEEAYRSSHITGRYIVKKVIQNEVITPNGDCHNVEQTSYINYQFKINTSKKLSLTLTNSPQSAIELGSALGQATKNKVVFHPTRIQLEDWITLLQKELRHFTLRRLDAIQVPIRNQTMASITLRGNGNLIEDLKELPNSEKAKITRAEFTYMSDYAKHRVTITHQGVATLQDKDTKNEIYPTLFSTLESLA